MYIKNGIEIYETIKDLIDKGITGVWDYQQEYYVRVRTDDYYDNGIWIVNKKSKDVHFGNYLEFMLDIMGNAKPVDSNVLKELLK